MRGGEAGCHLRVAGRADLHMGAHTWNLGRIRESATGIFPEGAFSFVLYSGHSATPPNRQKRPIHPHSIKANRRYEKVDTGTWIRDATRVDHTGMNGTQENRRLAYHPRLDCPRMPHDGSHPGPRGENVYRARFLPQWVPYHVRTYMGPLCGLLPPRIRRGIHKGSHTLQRIRNCSVNVHFFRHTMAPRGYYGFVLGQRGMFRGYPDPHLRQRCDLFIR